MRQTGISLIFVFFIVLAVTIGCNNDNRSESILTSTSSPETVVFNDKNLEEAIKTALDKQSGEEVLTSELANLHTLLASNSGITDLSGIEYCINLIELDLSNNQIIEINPLAALINLEVLILNTNQIEDISVLSELINLNWLNLNHNNLENLQPLVDNSGLGEGDRIFLLGNKKVATVEHTDPWQAVNDLQDRGVKVHHSSSW